jgi:hypothetical protein
VYRTSRGLQLLANKDVDDRGQGQDLRARMEAVKPAWELTAKEFWYGAA